MGLDMYLRADLYVSGYKHNKPEEQERFRAIVALVGMQDCADPGTPTVTVGVGARRTRSIAGSSRTCRAAWTIAGTTTSPASGSKLCARRASVP